MRRRTRGGGGVLAVITTIEAEVGGPSFTAVNVASAQSRNGVTVTLASTVDAKSATPTDLERRLQDAGVVHRRFARPAFQKERAKRWGISAAMPIWLFRRVRRYDALMVHYVWSFSSAAAVLAGWFWRVPVLLVPHESLTRFDIETSRSPRRGQQKVRMASVLLRGVDAVIFSSELEMRDSVHGSVAAHTIAHPVVLPDHLSDRAVPISGGQLVIGFLGRLHAKKRVELLIETLAELPDGVRLVVAGEEPREQLSALQALAAELGVSERVEFLGFVNEAERAVFFSRVDVLAMPSRYECFGMVAAEAMAAGLPVVVSDRTGVAETVRRHGAGVVFAMEETQELGVELTRMAQSPEVLSAMGKNAREAARSEFSLSAYSNAIERVWRGFERR